MVYISLIVNDTDILKQLPLVATSVDNTYLVITNLTVEDMSGNSNIPIPDGSALQVANFTGDMVPPRPS